MGILERISEIEKEISRTQKNKGNISPLYTIALFTCCEARHSSARKNKIGKLVRGCKHRNHSYEVLHFLL